MRDRGDIVIVVNAQQRQRGTSQTYKEAARMQVQEPPLEGQGLQSAIEESDIFLLLQQFEASERLRKAAGMQLEIADQLRKSALDIVRKQVDVTLGSPEIIYRLWADLRALVIEGRTAEAHEQRAQFESRLAMVVNRVKRAKRLAELAAKFNVQVPRAEEIAATIDELNRFHERVFLNWRTPADLENLVAADYRLPMARLDAIGARHPAPPSWYEQDDDPFKLEDG